LVSSPTFLGPSGSGKSTLAKLLPRFDDVTGGRVTIGGRDIRDYSTEEL
jgi:ATP-binding cassette subfamily B protein/ATP-binding cassette subfamily B protein IrtA